MPKNKKQNYIKSRAGFAILFAVLMSSFLISLGISIFSVSLKEIQITTSTRDSQVAYYAADSARECATYWDIKQGAFPSCDDVNPSDTNCSYRVDYATSLLTLATSPFLAPVTCNGNLFTLKFFKNGLTYSAISTLDPSVPFFQASSTLSSTPVADIKITKSHSFLTQTTMTAYGHNTGIIGRRVERSIVQTYNQ